MRIGARHWLLAVQPVRLGVDSGIHLGLLKPTDLPDAARIQARLAEYRITPRQAQVLALVVVAPGPGRLPPDSVFPSTRSRTTSTRIRPTRHCVARPTAGAARRRRGSPDLETALGLSSSRSFSRQHESMSAREPVAILRACRESGLSTSSRRSSLLRWLGSRIVTFVC